MTAPAPKCTTPGCPTRLRTRGPCFYCVRAERLIMRRLHPPIERTADCRWCCEPFTYTSRGKRYVCESCRAAKIGSERTVPPVQLPVVPDHGKAQGWRCVEEMTPCAKSDCRHYLGPVASTCSIREANAHPNGMELELIGSALKVTRERIRQIEFAAIRKIARSSAALALALREAMEE